MADFRLSDYLVDPAVQTPLPTDLDLTTTKLNTLAQKKQEKLGNLTRGQEIAENIATIDPNKYTDATLESIPDADSPTFVGMQNGTRLGGDPTQGIEGWVDAPEAYHSGFSETPKEQARIEKQMRQLGVSTPEEVYKANELARLDALYTLAGRPKDENGNEWTPGPIEYDVKNDPLMLGSKEMPLDMPVKMYDTGAKSGKRNVVYAGDPNLDKTVNERLAEQNYLFTEGDVAASENTKELADIDAKLAEIRHEENYWTNVLKGAAASGVAMAADGVDALFDAGANIGQKAAEMVTGEPTTAEDIQNLSKLGFQVDKDGKVRHYWDFQKEDPEKSSKEAAAENLGVDLSVDAKKSKEFTSTIENIWSSDADTLNKVGSTIATAWKHKDLVPSLVADSYVFVQALEKLPLTVLAGTTNEHLDERLKITGESANLNTTLAVSAGSAVELGVDYIANKLEFGVGDKIWKANRQLIDKVFAAIPKRSGETIAAKVLTGVVKRAAGATMATVEEGVTESVQEVIGLLTERIGTEYDGKEVWGLLDPETKQQIKDAGYLGALAGGGQAAAGRVYQDVVEGASKGLANVKEKQPDVTAENDEVNRQVIADNHKQILETTEVGSAAGHIATMSRAFENMNTEDKAANKGKFEEAVKHYKNLLVKSAEEGGEIVKMGAQPEELEGVINSILSADSDEEANVLVEAVKKDVNFRKLYADVHGINDEEIDDILAGLAEEGSNLRAIDAVSREVAVTGQDQERKGFLSYYLSARAGGTGRSELENFTNKQDAKLEKLTTKREELVDEVKTTLDGMVKAGLTKEDAAEELIRAAMNKQVKHGTKKLKLKDTDFTYGVHVNGAPAEYSVKSDFFVTAALKEELGEKTFNEVVSRIGKMPADVGTTKLDELISEVVKESEQMHSLLSRLDGKVSKKEKPKAKGAQAIYDRVDKMLATGMSDEDILTQVNNGTYKTPELKEQVVTTVSSYLASKKEEAVEETVAEEPIQEVEDTKEDLSNLTKKEQEFIEKYRAGELALSKAKTARYHKLMEKAKTKTPKPKKKKTLTDKAQRMKEAAEVGLGESEDAAKEEVKKIMAETSEKSKYDGMSDEDLAEMGRQYEELVPTIVEDEEERKAIQEVEREENVAATKVRLVKEDTLKELQDVAAIDTKRLEDISTYKWLNKEHPEKVKAVLTELKKRKLAEATKQTARQGKINKLKSAIATITKAREAKKADREAKGADLDKRADDLNSEFDKLEELREELRAAEKAAKKEYAHVLATEGKKQHAEAVKKHNAARKMYADKKKEVDEATRVYASVKKEYDADLKKFNDSNNAYKEVLKRLSGFMSRKTKEVRAETKAMRAAVTGTDEIKNYILTQAIKATDKVLSYVSKDKQTNVKMPYDFKELFTFKTNAKTTLGALPVELSATLSKEVAALKKVLEKLLPEASENKAGIWINSPARGIIFDKQGNLNDRIVGAMVVAIADTIANKGSSYMALTDAQIEGLYGIDASVDSVAAEKVRYLGMPKAYVASDLGKAIFANLGITMGKNANKEVYEKILMDIGQMAMYAAAKKYGLEVVEYNTNELRATLGKEATADEKATSELVRITNKAALAKSGELFRALEAEVMAESSVQGVRTSKRIVTDEEIVVRNNEYKNVNQSAKDTIKSMTNAEWRANLEVISELAKLGKDKVKELLGYTELDKDGNPTDGKARHYAAKVGLVGKNMQVERSVDALFELAEKIESGEMDNKMFFDWFYSRNGRFFMDSVGINPQTDKLHRFAIQLKAQEAELDTSKKENEDDRVYAFKLGLAQAFGFKVDGKAWKDSIKFANEILAMSDEELDAAVDALLASEKGEYEVNGITMKLEHLSHLLLGKIEAKKWNAANGGKFMSNMTFEADATTSAVGMKLMQIPVEVAIKWLTKAGIIVKNADGKYSDELVNALEAKDTRAVTNKLKNMGVGDLKALDEFLDSYQTLAVEMGTDENIVDNALNAAEETTKKGNLTKRAEALQSRLKELKVDTKSNATKAFTAFSRLLGEDAAILDEKGQVTSFGRNMFKYPFMIFLYGAGMLRIKKELLGTLEEAFAKSIVSGKISDEDIVKAFAAIGISVDAKQLKEDLQSVAYDKIMVGDKRLVDVTTVMYGDFYGESVVSVMQKEFGDLIAINESINTVMRVLMRAYLKAFDALTKGKEDLTVSQEIAIRKKLDRMFPAIKHPLGLDDRSDGIGIFDSERVERDSYKYLGATQTAIKDSDGNPTTKKVQSLRRELKEAITAGAVGFTHNEDGAVIGLVLADGTVLGIHDALVLGIAQVDKIGNYHVNMLNISNNWNQLDELIATWNDIAQFEVDGLKGKDFLAEVMKENDETEEYGDRLDITGALTTIQTNANELRKEKDRIHKEAVMMHVAFGHKGKIRAEEVSKQNKSIVKFLNNTSEDLVGRLKDLLDNAAKVAEKKGC